MDEQARQPRRRHAYLNDHPVLRRSGHSKGHNYRRHRRHADHLSRYKQLVYSDDLLNCRLVMTSKSRCSDAAAPSSEVSNHAKTRPGFEYLQPFHGSSLNMNQTEARSNSRFDLVQRRMDARWQAGRKDS
ncbi:unnamed protein product [Protopolystoma xenopodis]|uniref:Uncharacterized protein n=1 Tax=Protopolystoma xenopodis TaxID=117903 RepID=A0A3S5B0V3_9PLAT|nr:unnamed protein product [Protopolystoma xenopodis]